MHNFNIYTRRQFLGRTFKTSMAVALATLTDIPFVMKRALAEGSIGLNGKKILFIWLRGANDGLNSVIPIEDPAYAASRSTIGIQKDPIATNASHPSYNPGYYSQTGPCFDPTLYSDSDFTARTATDDTYSYNYSVKLGNGFAALHPSLKFLAPLYNVGDLSLIHRVAYPKQSRSHFDSQKYWENGSPNNNLAQDGIFYRAIIESGLANSSPLTGISIQSSLPLILRGSEAAMTNLTDPTRYDLLGVPTPNGDLKALNSIVGANYHPFAPKQNREMLDLQYENMTNTLRIFAGLGFSEDANIFRDDIKTDNDTDWYPGVSNDSQGYYLFPTTDAKNGGSARPGGSTNDNKEVVASGQYSFFSKLKSAAMILNNTDAIIAGTEFSGFDTHQAQGGTTGNHANLLRTIGWSMYALRKYFLNYADKATWDNTIVITLSEFGRTSVQNGDLGTDHAEAGLMFVAGGAVKGYGAGNTTGVFGCSPGEAIPWNPGLRTTNFATCGTMFAAGFPNSNNPAVAGYLRRSSDYRSVLGEILRKHLGATQAQLNKIIPGYANTGEALLSGGTSSVDGVDIRGEIGIL